MAKFGAGQVGRRDFLVGAAAGATAGAAVWVGAPPAWHEAMLPLGARLSYAQQGEDLVAEALLHDLGIDRPTYLDVGAYEPIVGSNTYLFWRKGCRGVLVEPNVALRPALLRERPGDAVLTAGVGVTDEAEADYYVTILPQRNTFSKEDVDAFAAEAKREVLVEVVKMPLIDINRAIADHLGAAPDFLSIDVEGLDLPILRTLDFGRYRPALICAEHGHGATRAGLAELLGGHGYEPRGQTAPNTLYADTRRKRG